MEKRKLSYTIGRNIAFEPWCWRRLLRVPWTARRSNQSTLKEINPEYTLEGLMLKLKLQYFGHLMGRADSFEKTMMLGKTEGRKKRGWQRKKWLYGITDSMDMSLNKLRVFVIDMEAWHAAFHSVIKSWTPLSDWTELNWWFKLISRGSPITKKVPNVMKKKLINDHCADTKNKIIW